MQYIGCGVLALPNNVFSSVKIKYSHMQCKQLTHLPCFSALISYLFTSVNYFLFCFIVDNLVTLLCFSFVPLFVL